MRTYLTLFVLSFFLLQASTTEAQNRPPEHRITPQLAKGAEDVYTADLNGDGLPDIITASRQDDRIAWHSNKGDGSFSEQKTISTNAANARSVFASDLDGDNDLDILSASSADQKIAWYENDGSGSFSSQKVITTDADGATSVYAADLDGDTDPDVLSASFRDNKIAWYENEGSGSFSAEKTITTSANSARSVYVADLNGDGYPDALSASAGDNKVAWYANDGTGSFSTQNVVTTNAAGAESVYAIDLDGDSKKDILSASSGDDKIAWYNNEGSGSFSSQKVITTQAVGAISVYASDLDTDGDKDVLAASLGDNTISAFDNQIGTSNADSDGFGGELTVSTQADLAQSVHSEDLDGDGDKDILSASSGDDKIAWYANELDSGGGFSSQKKVVPYGLVEKPISVYAADLDGDGDKDVLSASRTDEKIAWYQNYDSGGFSGQQVIAVAGAGAESVYAADLDGDGLHDVLSASGSKVAWYKNEGNGAFSSEKVISTNAQNVQAVYATDLDGDENVDVLSASVNDDKVAWYRNDGGGSFSSQKVITTNANSARSVFAADLDGDGRKDVLSASYQDNKIAWYRNKGDGSFSSTKVITDQATGAISVHAADLDNDGDVDVLSAAEGGFNGSSEITWYQNSSSFGSITFSPSTISSNVQAAQDVRATDLNGDNLPDVISASGLDDKVAWYKNSGGSFESQKTISFSLDGPASVHAADLDGDSDKDVLSAAFRGNEIAWFENTNDTLPVELASFNGRNLKSNGKEIIRLTWKTASETNNASFQVQRQEIQESSNQYSDWKTIGRKAGSGTTDQPQFYRFMDQDPPFAADTLRYRLRQIDTDGTTQTHDEISVVRTSPDRLTLKSPYPNPVQQRATVRYSIPEGRKEESEAHLRLYDVLGRQVRSISSEVKPGRHKHELYIGELSSGVYFLHLKIGEQVRTQKLTVIQ